MLISVQNAADTLQANWIKVEPEREFPDQMVAELHQRYPFDLDNIKEYIGKLKTDGSWSDINYLDNKRSWWEPKRHAERILELAKLKCLNWWYNEIGIPKTLGTAFVRLGPQHQLGNCGLAFISSMSFYYRLSKGTSYELDKQQVSILTFFVNENNLKSIKIISKKIRATG